MPKSDTKENQRLAAVLGDFEAAQVSQKGTVDPR